MPDALGEFRVQAVLGEGGSGIVYDAIWGPRRVALKVLHPSLTDTERVRAQFFAEAQRLQAITHPSVVKVFGSGELPDGRPYLAMERLEGETLATVLARGPMAVPSALVLFAELCHAVQTLHEQGLIHRDLKPENVFIVDGVHAVLLDFGIAKDLAAAASTTTMEGNVRGTPAYMAPERFFGQPAAIATDVYELAVTLYVMLAGTLPWADAADPEARLSPRPLVELADVRVPIELDVEIRRAMSTRAQNRPASARALLSAVREAAAHGGGAIDGEPAPGPADTARMRPALDPQRPVVASSTGRTDPQVRAADPHVVRPRRTIAIAIAIAIAIGAVVTWRVVRTQGTPIPSPVVAPASGDDPWAPRPATPVVATPTFPTEGPPVTMEDAQVQVAAAIPHLPADTSMLVTGLIGPLRRDVRFAPLFAKIAVNPQAKSLMSGLPPCMTALVDGAEWFVFGSVGFAVDNQGTLIVRGRWSRRDVASCFAAQAKEPTVVDGATLYELPSLGWLAFLDDHTVYLSIRRDLTAAQVNANVTGRGVGLTPHARALLAKLPARRALVFVLDGTESIVWPAGTMPPGSDGAGWIRTHDVGFTLQMMFDAKAEPAAIDITRRLQAEIDPFKYANIGTLTATRDKTRITLDGEIPSLVLGMITSSLP